MGLVCVIAIKFYFTALSRYICLIDYYIKCVQQDEKYFKM